MQHWHRAAVKAHVQALVLLALQAIDASVAGPARRNGDAVADREPGYGGTQRLDGPGNLVTEDHRLAHSHRAETAMVEIMQIRSADTAGLDGDLDLSRTGCLGLAFLDPKIAGSMNDDGFHCCPSDGTMATIERCLETGGDPTIDIERVAIDEGRRLAGQEHSGPDQLLDISPATGRRPLFEPAREFRIVDQRLVELGLEVARRDGIDLEAIFGPIGAHATGQVLYGALRGRVGRDARPREFALHGGDVDDLALAASDHMTGDGLADIERTRNIGDEQLLPFFDGEI